MKDSKKTSRRSFAKLAVAALAVLPIGASYVTGQSRRRKKTTRAQIKQISPITVGGGGSVGLDFSETYYEKVGTTDRYINKKGDTIERLWIIDKHGKRYDCLLPRADCTITIHCTDPSGNPRDSKVMIFGAPMGIEFTGSEFPFEYPEPDAQEKMHHNGKRKITDRIEIRDNRTGAISYCDVPTNGQCNIVAVDTL